MTLTVFKSRSSLQTVYKNVLTKRKKRFPFSWWVCIGLYTLLSMCDSVAVKTDQSFVIGTAGNIISAELICTKSSITCRLCFVVVFVRHNLISKSILL